MNLLPIEAERIAEMGYPVFPCRDPRDDPSPVGKKGKIPLTSNGVSGATINLEQVNHWWTKWPTANIGLACKYCLVIDLDNKDGKNGSADCAAISEKLGPLQPVVLAATGSGGWHLFFAQPDIEIVGRTNVEWQGRKTGIDIRVGNQYIIAPPSLHESGEHYAWHTPLVPSDKLTPVPQAWIDGFLPKKNSGLLLPARHVRELPDEKIIARCRKYVSTMPKAVSGQGGHPVTLSVANAIFWGFGLDEATGWPILVDYNIDCQPPWSESELRRKMRQAVEKPPPGKEFRWLLNANHERYDHSDFSYKGRPVREKSLEDELLAPKLTTFNREEITCLWQNRFVNGKLNLICGDGSVGKTWFLCYMCAVVSRGVHWADGSPCKQGGIIFFTSEDGAGDTLRPRIEDNGGDVDHIYVPQVVIRPDGTPKEFSINEIHSLARFIEKLEEQYGIGYVKLVVFDPITAFMGDIDEFKNNQVRATFRPMARLAEEKNFTWIGVGHPKKGAEMGRAKDAFSGSIAYTNAARLLWNFYHDRQSGIRRMLLAKNNLLRNPKGLAYIVNDGIISFTDTDIEMDADDYQRQHQPSGGRGRPNVKTKEAEDWLREYLKDGPKPSGNRHAKESERETVFGDAEAAGFKHTTIWRASDDLGVIKKREASSNRWIWSLPESGETETAETGETTEKFDDFAAFR
jgi:hypothetical protein